MLNNELDIRHASVEIGDQGQIQYFTHPDEVLHDGSLSADRKREILAGWTSDAHAVANLPNMRQLESGAIVNVDAILTALRALDTQNRAVQAKPRGTRFWGRKRLRFFLGRQNDDDDDPPPCPAAALPPDVELELRRRRDAEWKFASAA